MTAPGSRSIQFLDLLEDFVVVRLQPVRPVGERPVTCLQAATR